MPAFEGTQPDAGQPLVKPSRGFHQRAVYREHLASLGPGMTLEIAPEGAESLRKLKVNVTRAAHELNLTIGYGSTAEGTEAPSEQAASRGRSRTRSDGV
jgi:hypothetical protein